MNRRNLFANFAGDDPSAPKSPFTPHPASLGARVFTNASLRTHENKEVRFYDDLIMGRQVIINMMYATCTSACPLVTSKLIKVHEALKDRMGKDLFIYSISLKPEQDDPAALKKFAEMHGAANLPGWLFLTGDPYDIETIRFRLFRWDHIKFDLDVDIHASMLRIINDATNCWTMTTPDASMYTILQHISWADPPKSLEERLEENKAIQERINKEVKQYGYRKTT
ncbi:MAG: SCO family protein [Blastocatellia bacterium]|nr:SCO family protein [Blastocatellia bacterium]